MPKKGAKPAAKTEEIDVGEETFENADAGSAKTIPKQCSALRKGENVMIKGHPCKIVDMSTSKTGKHGHAKVHLVALDIFDGKKYEDICPSTHNMEVPVSKTTTYDLTDIDEEGFCDLMGDEGMRSDLKMPDNLLEQAREKMANSDGVEVSVLKACGKEQIMKVQAQTRPAPL